MKRRTTEEWIVNAKKAHAGKVPDDWYDYSRVDYKGSTIKVEIGCEEHGFFWQHANHHLTRGCPQCNLERGYKANTYTFNTFIEKATIKHGAKGDWYDYSRVDYKGSIIKVEIGCEEHGFFWQEPRCHLSGQGCPKCAIQNRKPRPTKSTEQYIIEAEDVHVIKVNGITQPLYDYSRADYIGSLEVVEIGCKRHGFFWQRANGHLQGNGCPKCGFERSTRYFLNIPTMLYYIKVTDLDGTDYWKIGITSNTIKGRFKKIMDYIEVIWTKPYSTGKKAYDMEQKILHTYERKRAYNKNVLLFKKGGWTELFTEDVLHHVDVTWGGSLGVMPQSPL